jgi:hypothetical protein
MSHSLTIVFNDCRSAARSLRSKFAIRRPELAILHKFQRPI